MKKKLSVKAFLEDVAHRRPFRIIDLRGDYLRTIPGATPSLFDPDIFFENEDWTQDMLGVTFYKERPVLLICATGANSNYAMTLFYQKNPQSSFHLASLEGGFDAYLAHITELTNPFKNRDRFIDELTDLRTPVERFQHIITGLLRNQKPKGWKKLFNLSAW